MRVLIAATAVAFVMGGTASAQSNGAILKCRAMADKEQRLACYDGIADTLNPATPGEAAGTAGQSAEAEMQAKAAAFGAEKIPAKARAGAAGEEEKLDTLDAAIARIGSDQSGNMIFDLDNGQTWRVLSGTMALPPIHVGDAVQLSRSSLGGYRLKLLDVRRTVPVKRIR